MDNQEHTHLEVLFYCWIENRPHQPLGSTHSQKTEDVVPEFILFIGDHVYHFMKDCLTLWCSETSDKDSVQSPTGSDIWMEKRLLSKEM